MYVFNFLNGSVCVPTFYLTLDLKELDSRLRLVDVLSALFKSVVLMD